MSEAKAPRLAASPCMRFLSATQLTRSFVCRSLALLPLLVDERAPAAEPVPSDVEVVPLDLCGGAYCLNYTLDEQQFRAVVDTGSPFVLVDGTCGAKFVAAGENNVWGCYRGDGRPSGLKDTEELFGGEDVGTQWRRGSLAIEPAGRLASVDDAIFGVVRSYVGKGGGGAVFFGLAKRRLPRIRPTFLEQTAIRALRFDFVQRTLALSAAPLIPSAADAVRTIDLRPRGAPVATYAARISRLVVNGEAVSLDRAAVAIVDTGTTGLSVCDELFDSGRVPTQVRQRGSASTSLSRACARSRPCGAEVAPDLDRPPPPPRRSGETPGSSWPPSAEGTRRSRRRYGGEGLRRPASRRRGSPPTPPSTTSSRSSSRPSASRGSSRASAPWSAQTVRASSATAFPSARAAPSASGLPRSRMAWAPSRTCCLSASLSCGSGS